jgi:hypothetical protein
MNSIVFQHSALWVLPIALAVILLLRPCAAAHSLRFRPQRCSRLCAPSSRLRHIPTIVAAAALPLIAIALTEPVPYACGTDDLAWPRHRPVLDLSLSMQEWMGQPG